MEDFDQLLQSHVDKETFEQEINKGMIEIMESVFEKIGKQLEKHLEKQAPRKQAPAPNWL
ncbi:MAG: hypothetical protein MRY79_04165 [Alphaproteobacteria bacterium]|nr:hypothetical protein [Alphaproteobacteria bacterium]